MNTKENVQDDNYTVPLEEALDRLDVIAYDQGGGESPHVHTFRSSSFGLLGGHWELEDLTRVMKDNGVEESGPQASAMSHGLVVRQPEPSGPLFLATKPVSA